MDTLKKNLTNDLPIELVEPLLLTYTQIKENYYLRKHEPAELNGAKFCEIIVRILEYEETKNFTPIGQHITNMGDKFKSFESKTALNESIRFHIPKIASSIYNIRNKRGVGHVSGEISPNLADSTFVATSADWILAEIIRIHHQCSLEEAQKIIDTIVERKLPLVYEIANKKRILNPRLKFSEKTLIILASEYPESIMDRTLWDWVEHSNFYSYKKVLSSLHKEKLIEYTNSTCVILPPGLKMVEDNYTKWATYS